MAHLNDETLDGLDTAAEPVQGEPLGAPRVRSPLADDNLLAALEAILFTAGEPLTVKRVAGALQCSRDGALAALETLQARLDTPERGICLLHLGDAWQLCAKPDYAPAVRETLEIKRNVPLSAAAFEVLAIIAYHQPITKSYCEQVRGVDCAGVVNTLCQRGLVEEKGRLDLPGRPLTYGTTPDFLRCFCLESLDELPEIEAEAQ
ncbi:MAG: SMC-Scp complex subunit ScpB [Oscillospiraceae bacterium]|jgi:segregation and condensation protein B|nr:SMC-Scp complex subunit ScpB [Oscillospiraceae bacterium]